jgi:hypothetical protein
MASYTFQITPQLIKLAKHAVANHAHQRLACTGEGWGIPEAFPAQPSMLIVKDSGCYLMSSFPRKGAPNSAVLKGADGKAAVVVYAKGARPEDGHIAGDDFADDLPGLPDLILQAGSGFAFVKMSATRISFGVSK